MPFDSFATERAGLAGAISRLRQAIGHVHRENEKLRDLIAEFEASAFHNEMRVAYRTVN